VGVGFNDPAWLEEEQRLVERAVGGERAAVARLYAAFAPPLYGRILLPILGDRDAAEDALAETFRAAIERLAGFRYQGASLWYWLQAIGRSKAMDLHRARARANRALATFARLLEPLAPWDEAAGAAFAEPDQRRLRGAVGEALARINPRYRQALEARFLEERSRDECARLLGVTLGTFDVVLLRALRAFRREWEARHGVGHEEVE
jgi:RNA polymerase sigma-70 factor (ECF subfamily)